MPQSESGRKLLVRISRGIVAVLVTFFVTGLAAADIPVTYDVDQKAVKSGLVFGDALTFDLYTASDCLSGLVHSEILGAGRVGCFHAKSRSPLCSF